MKKKIEICAKKFHDKYWIEENLPWAIFHRFLSCPQKQSLPLACSRQTIMFSGICLICRQWTYPQGNFVFEWNLFYQQSNNPHWSGYTSQREEHCLQCCAQCFNLECRRMLRIAGTRLALYFANHLWGYDRVFRSNGAGPKKVGELGFMTNKLKGPGEKSEDPFWKFFISIVVFFGGQRTWVAPESGDNVACKDSHLKN